MSNRRRQRGLKMNSQKNQIKLGIKRGLILITKYSRKCCNCGSESLDLFCQECSIAQAEYIYSSVPRLFAERLSINHGNGGNIVDELLSFSRRNDYRPDLILMKISIKTGNIIMLTQDGFNKITKEVESWNLKPRQLTFLA